MILEIKTQQLDVGFGKLLYKLCIFEEIWIPQFDFVCFWKELVLMRLIAKSADKTLTFSVVNPSELLDRTQKQAIESSSLTIIFNCSESSE